MNPRLRYWLCRKLGHRRDVLVVEQRPVDVAILPDSWQRYWACHRCDHVWIEGYVEPYSDWLARSTRQPRRPQQKPAGLFTLLFGIEPPEAP